MVALPAAMAPLEAHPLADIFPLLDGAAFEELAADIAAHGLREPIVLFDGMVLDGRNRLRACEMAGVRPHFETYTGDDPAAYVVSLNLRRRHLSESQRAMVAARLANVPQGRPGKDANLQVFQDDAARLLNVSPRSVATARSVLTHGAPALQQAVDAGRVRVSAAADIAGEAPERQAEIVARGEREILQAAKAIRADKARDRAANKAFFTGENEWYTPAEYLDAARACLGAIDLDPASSDYAQQRVNAAQHFTVADDGLAREWRGRVWLNPPYSQPEIGQFVGKLVAEHSAGRVSEAILLTHNYTDTRWFQEIAAACSAICFTRGRVRFDNATGEVASPTQGQAFSYFGPAAGVERFVAAFRDHGFIVVPA